ncbi:hypothetical protein X946_5303 [Burkholderia sp. ABCPW 111]|nr:hypothetical protein X946_5303 [Burkholderia sp. ABCPW 111]
MKYRITSVTITIVIETGFNRSRPDGRTERFAAAEKTVRTVCMRRSRRGMWRASASGPKRCGAQRCVAAKRIGPRRACCPECGACR